MYPYITREIWDQFVKKCSTKEFQAKSAKARISQAANKHPHFLGQKSYAEMIPIWQSRGYIPSATTSSVDSSTSSLITSLPDRTLPWLLARSKKDKDGKLFFPNEETQKIKESIDDWKKKEAEGEFVPGRMDDALSRALQRKDRPGRVLTAGHSIGITSVWGDPDRRSSASKGKGMDDERFRHWRLE
ncbi:uncharacterized protein LOC130591788 [Beta vulgaris subsp. vulgaris]|uniref:uncharacterized protein LOC130591788 n=1 Tax=Beta vulgaris subsp. vulgaris TaxID=3555 RepID=UPI00254834FF|nr:uncharacterized protein LOC130591788 [Beta vulgaris subsp. vulgaris]